MYIQTCDIYDTITHIQWFTNTLWPGEQVCVEHFETARFLAPCVVPTNNTRGTVTRQSSDTNYRCINWTNKRLYKCWHTGQMLSHKGLSFDQQGQDTCIRHVRNMQCTADNFNPFSVHLARRLAGEVPCLTSMRRTALCLQQQALNIARYCRHFTVKSVDLWYKKVPFKRHVQADRHYCQRMHMVFLELNWTLNSSEKV